MDRFAEPVKTVNDVQKYLEITYKISEEFASEICSRYQTSINLAIREKMSHYSIGDEIADLEALTSENETDDYFEEAAKNDTH